MPDVMFESAAEMEPVEFDSIEAVSFEQPRDHSGESTGDVESDCKRELGVVEAGFVARAKAEQARMIKATDSEYWVCLCFQTREEVEEFTKNAGLGKGDEKYLDGRKVAKRFGVEITRDNTPFGTPRVHKTWAGMARKIEVQA